MNNESPELVMYRSVFRLMLKADGERILQNDSKSHAIVLIEELIRHATKEVYIYCTRLDDTVWGVPSVLDSIDEAFNRKVTFHVLTREVVPDETLALKSFKQHDCKIGQAHLENGNVIVENFLVVDGKSFRFESAPQERKGFVCVNNPEVAMTLINIFNKLAGVGKVESFGKHD